MTSAQGSPRLPRPTLVSFGCRALALVTVLGTWLALAAGCATHDLPMSTASSSGRAPPPKPGSSITHTQLCRCVACEDPACCTREAEGERETEQCRANEEGQIECGLAMKSCGRCQELAFRVSLSTTCEAKRPADCCREVAVRR